MFCSSRDIDTDIRSTLVAMNVANHKLAWRRLLENRCSGSITAAGGLIFAGRFDGQLTALDSDTGQRLWSSQTDGGFTTTATISSTRACSISPASPAAASRAAGSTTACGCSR